MNKLKKLIKRWAVRQARKYPNDSDLGRRFRYIAYNDKDNYIENKGL